MQHDAPCPTLNGTKNGSNQYGFPGTQTHAFATIRAIRQPCRGPRQHEPGQHVVSKPGTRRLCSPYWRALSSASKMATGDAGLIASRAFNDSSHISVSAAVSTCLIPAVMWS